MPVMTMVEAIRSALGDALERDERVLVFGQDVGVNGGMFRATDGLQGRFGAERVVDMPLAEAVIVGSAVGLCWVFCRASRRSWRSSWYSERVRKRFD